MISARNAYDVDQEKEPGHLAGHYADTNRRDEAVALAEEVRKSFPEAVDHTGGSLIEMLQRMKLLPLK